MTAAKAAVFFVLRLVSPVYTPQELSTEQVIEMAKKTKAKPSPTLPDPVKEARDKMIDTLTSAWDGGTMEALEELEENFEGLFDRKKTC